MQASASSAGLSAAAGEVVFFESFQLCLLAIGQVGSIVGEAAINIGGMQVARSEKRDTALMLLSADSELPHEVAARIAEAIGAEHFAVVNL